MPPLTDTEIGMMFLHHNLALQDYTGLGTTLANEMNFGIKHAPGAGLIARPVGLQSSTLSLYQDCSPIP